MFSTDSTHIRDISGRTMVLDRIAALEAALVEVARFFDDGSSNDWEGCAEVRAILARVGLAHRLPGNPNKAEETVAS